MSKLLIIITVIIIIIIVINKLFGRVITRTLKRQKKLIIYPKDLSLSGECLTLVPVVWWAKWPISWSLSCVWAF